MSTLAERTCNKEPLENLLLHTSTGFVLSCYHSCKSCTAALALCDDPVDIENGTVTFNGILVGDMATYNCDSGFELIGDATTTCTLVDMDSAEFQPAPPFCRREYTK